MILSRKLNLLKLKEKQTQAFGLMVGGVSRYSQYEYFHDTWEEAHGFLSRHAESKEVYLSGKLAEITSVRHTLANMKRPE